MTPPARRVEDLHAVPIHIRRIDARLSFNASTLVNTGAADVDFDHGGEDGCPVFDLRQPISAVRIDGEPVDPESVLARDFGGGPWAQMRVLPRAVAAGSRHRMSFEYRLGRPVAPIVGGRQPGLELIPGGVRFNFGFSDLGGGRYLESWIPANLIYNRFRLTIRVTVAGASQPHTLITNAREIEQDGNEWLLGFPDSTTALSPMVELHPASELRNRMDEVTLPVSRRRVRVEVWKQRTHPARLQLSLAKIIANLEANERLMGEYLHSDRYVAFLQERGGMEYDGGCTSSVDALQHEVFHSWWARGLKPASQADGWIDEAWTVYNDSGACTRRPFDFDARPVELCAANPWTRHTPGAAYTEGYRFFQGLARWFGPEQLNAWMVAIYRKHAPGLISTQQLEEELVAASGEQRVHAAFDRFVYGRDGHVRVS